MGWDRRPELGSSIHGLVTKSPCEGMGIGLLGLAATPPRPGYPLKRQGCAPSGSLMKVAPPLSSKAKPGARLAGDLQVSGRLLLGILRVAREAAEQHVQLACFYSSRSHGAAPSRRRCWPSDWLANKQGVLDLGFAVCRLLKGVSKEAFI